jgi:uncharacterized protein with HEPN domain
VGDGSRVISKEPPQSHRNVSWRGIVTLRNHFFSS